MDRAGGTEAFDAFYRAEFGRLAGALALMAADRARGEDLAQEAMVRAYRSWDRVGTMDRPVAWLHTVGTNLVRRDRRRRKPPAVAAPPPVDVGDAFGRHDELRAALSRLPADQRTVVVVRHVLGYSTAEAAEVLGRSGTAVRALLHRAVLALRADLTDRVP